MYLGSLIDLCWTWVYELCQPHRLIAHIGLWAKGNHSIAQDTEKIQRYLDLLYQKESTLKKNIFEKIHTKKTFQTKTSVFISLHEPGNVSRKKQ